MEMTAIGWAVSPIIRFMIDKTLGYLQKPLKRTYGMEADLEKLKQILHEVQSVVSVAETLKVVNPHQAELLRQIKEAVYDAEDVVDEFNYRLLEAEAAKEDSVAEKFGVMVLTAGKRLVGADPLQASLSKAIESLNCVDQTANAFIRAFNLQNAAYQVAGQSSGPQQAHVASDRVTTSRAHEKIFGRDDDTKSIVDKIKDQADCSSARPLVISVVGVGGIGKTTLAQKVYNHEEIASNVIDVKMWVFVENTFNFDTVTKQVLAKIKGKTIDCDSLDTVQNEISKELGSKKFLLILDDVWVDENKYNNSETWKKFFSTFHQCKGGSSILVTTRLASVANMIDDCIKIDLKGLSKEDSEELFMSHAFPDGVGESTELEVIGKDIAEKLKGLPLALTVVGMQLKGNHSINYWNNVLSNTVSAAGDVIKILKLSYDHLPSHLKPCFGYCSLFPKGYEFTEDEINQLIHMWIAQGFIHNKDGSDASLEDIGQSYFDILCSRSFFQPTKDILQRINGYVMHDLINDLAQFVSREECWQLESHPSNSPSTLLRHVSVYSTNLHVLCTSTNIQLHKLRTLLVLNRSNGHVCTQMDDATLASLKGARVLDLSGCCNKLPKTIKKMIHLRYLALNPTSELLPETCSRLFNLQVVGMRAQRRLGICEKGRDNCVPKNMGKLTNLRHVYVLDGNPIEIISHCKIPQFHGDAVFTLNPGERFEAIKDIGFQRSLVIQGLKNVYIEEEEFENDTFDEEVLYDDAFYDQDEENDRKEKMRKLKLKWCSSCWASRNNDDEVLDVQESHPNLHKLITDGHLGIKSPLWFKKNWLTSLLTIKLYNRSKLMDLPPLGDLPKLKYLEIIGLNALKEIPKIFYGTKEVTGFPSLQKLELRSMQNLVEWSMPIDRPLFPLLQQVFVRKCSELRELPPLGDLPKLINLELSALNAIEEISPKIYGTKGEFGFPSLDTLELKDMQNLIEWSMPECRPLFPLLEQVVITKCYKLRRIPNIFPVTKCSELFIDEFFFFFDFRSCELTRSSGVQDNIEEFRKRVSFSRDQHLFWKVTYNSGFKSVSCNDTKSLLEVQACKLDMLDFHSHPEAVEELYIFQCTEPLPKGVFTKLSSLERLSIEKCKVNKMFEGHGEEDDDVDHFPTSLKSLIINEWDGYPSRNVVSRCFRSLSSLTCLTTMEIMGSPQLSLTITQYDFLKPFSSLSTLKISDLRFYFCEDEILDLQHSRGLKVLHISCCKGRFKLINCNALTLLTELVIDACPGLTIHPADLTFLKSLNNLNMKLNGWAPLLYDGFLSFTTEDIPKTVARNLIQGSNPMSMDFHPVHQAILLVGTYAGDIELWDVGTRERLVLMNFKVWELSQCSKTLQVSLDKNPAVYVNRVIWSPDGSLFGVAYSKRVVQIYSYHGGGDIRQHLEIDAHTGGVNDIAFSHPNKQLCVITCGDDKTVKAWDATSGARQYTFKGHDAPVYSVCPHHKENVQFIFSTALDGKIKAWLYNNLGSRVDYDAGGSLMTMAYSTDGTRLFSCGKSKDGESYIVEWNESEGTVKRTYQGFRKRSLGVVQFDTTKNRYLAAGDEFVIKFWDMDNTDLLTTLDAEGGLPASPKIRFNKEGTLLAVSTLQNGIKILANADGLRLLCTFEGQGRPFDAFRAISESNMKPIVNPLVAATAGASTTRAPNTPQTLISALNGDTKGIVDIKPRIVEDAADKSKMWKFTEISEPAQCQFLGPMDNLRTSKLLGSKKKRKTDVSTPLMPEQVFRDGDFDTLGFDDRSRLFNLIFNGGTIIGRFVLDLPFDLFNAYNNINITYKDIKDLLNANWLNVSVIQLYILKLHRYCQKKSIPNIGFMDPERINATYWGTDKQATINYIADTMQSRKTILAPYYEDQHWVLLVIKPSKGTVYVLDSLSNRRAKHYVIKDAFAQAMQLQGAATFSWITENWSPQQIGGFECGYYVMNLMQDIITTNPEFPKGSLPQKYTESKIDSVRQSWIHFFLELSEAKAFRSDYQQSTDLPIVTEEPEEASIEQSQFKSLKGWKCLYSD